MTWILVIYIYAGMLAKGDSVTLLNAGEFASKAACESAGKAADPLVDGSAKDLRFVCLPKSSE